MTPPLTISQTEAAQILGIGKSSFYAKRDKLYEAGFPRPDPLLRRFNRADVLQWVENRRQVPGKRPTVEGPATWEVNTDAL